MRLRQTIFFFINVFVALFIAIFTVVIITSALAKTVMAEISPLDAQSMDARVLITNTVDLTPTGKDYLVKEMQGSLSWFPREYYLQEVKTLTTEPESGRTPDYFVFYWNAPLASEDIFLQSTITTRNAIMPVREKIPFPIDGISPDVAIYLSEGEIIDQSPEIKELAQQLASGKDDEYEVVYALADWTTKNINYSLASLGAPASQTSSEVMKSRYGKCDELTSLFISMNRALGIPARFAAGYSYTNSKLFRQGWGGHGWAEVWYPDYGWVPYDVTYGEYGYLDAGHVLLKIAPDAKEDSIDYTARGTGFSLRTQPLKITVTPVGLTEKTNPEIGISLDAPVKRVGFGSVVLILVNVENKRDYYVSTRLDIAKTSNTEMLSSDYQNVLLKPYEKKVVPFLVKIDDTLNNGYVYEFPFKVISRIGESAVITIDVNEQAPYYDSSAFAEEMARYARKGDGTRSFSVTCDQGRPAYANNIVEHECTVKGTKELSVCYKGNCVLPAIESGVFSLKTNDSLPGVYTKTYIAKTASDSINFFVTSRTIAKPKLNISISLPSTARVDDAVDAVVEIKSSNTPVRHVETILSVRHSDAQEDLPDLSRPAKINFALPGRALRPGENNVLVTVRYQDELGTNYTDTVSSSIGLVDVGVFDRMGFWLEDAGYWLAGMFE